MGREAECEVRWGDQLAQARVQLESQELVLRGAMKRRIPLASLKDPEVRGDRLTFTADGTPVALALGPERSKSWLKAIQTPPPTLAKKLGIKPESRLLVWGDLDVKELAAVATATGDTVDLILIGASTPLELEQGLGSCWPLIEQRCPVWIVYTKGKSSILGEAAVREKLRSLGLIDTKVASVSEHLTALRFIRR